jgi:transposase
LRQQKRNLRARMKQARASFVEGCTIREISSSLDEAPKIVERWVAGLKRGRKAPLSQAQK